MQPTATNPIVITGGTGFAGSHLVEHLLTTYQPELIHVTAFSTKPSFVHQLLPATQIHTLDLTDSVATSHLIAQLKPSQLYHLAASAAVGSSFDKALTVIDQNTHLQYSVLEAIKTQSPTTRVVVVGSAQEYDTQAATSHSETVTTQATTLSEASPLGPGNPYGVSKVVQDMLGLSYFYAYQLPILRVRPFNHIGERQEPGFAVSDFTRQLVQVERGELPHLAVGNLKTVRDFTDVKDVVRAYELIMNQGVPGEVYNVGSGRGTSLETVLKTLLSLSPNQIRVVVDQTKLRSQDSTSIVANNAKISRLGWSPEIALTDTLKRVVTYWRTQT